MSKFIFSLIMKNDLKNEYLKNVIK